MKIKKILTTACAALCLAQTAVAVPAYPGVIKAKQADGTTVSIRLHGDEFGHYATTEDGFPIVFNPVTNNYEYAVMKNGVVECCGIVAADATVRTQKAKNFLAAMDKESIVRKMLNERKENKEARYKSTRDFQAKLQKASGKKPQKQLMNDFPHFWRATFHCDIIGIQQLLIQCGRQSSTILYRCVEQGRIHL